MTGSSLAPIIIPIVVMASLAAWIVMVFYAERHPLWRHGQARPHADTQPSALADRQQPRRGSAPRRAA